MTEHHPDRQGEGGVEEVLDEIVDLEEYARLGKRPPLSRGYRIRSNGEPYVLHEAHPTGRKILTLAGLLPAENYTLRVKLTGEKPRKERVHGVVVRFGQVAAARKRRLRNTGDRSSRTKGPIMLARLTDTI